MTQQETIADIEQRAARLGIAIRNLCAMAEVHPTSFSRWKRSERNPNPTAAKMDRIDRLYAALDRLEKSKAA